MKTRISSLKEFKEYIPDSIKKNFSDWQTGKHCIWNDLNWWVCFYKPSKPTSLKPEGSSGSKPGSGFNTNPRSNHINLTVPDLKPFHYLPCVLYWL